MPSSCGFNKSFIIIEYLHDIHRYLHDIHCLFDMRNDCRAQIFPSYSPPHSLSSSLSRMVVRRVRVFLWVTWLPPGSRTVQSACANCAVYSSQLHVDDITAEHVAK